MEGEIFLKNLTILLRQITIYMDLIIIDKNMINGFLFEGVNKKMKTGKLDSDLLKKIVFKNIKYKRQEVLVRPGIGEDCAVVDYGDNVCVMSTDPITGASNDVGRLAIHISCNDIASNGVEPLGIMLTIMVPEGTTEEEINEIMKQAGREAEKLNIEIIGGHTEITNAVNKAVIVSTAIGKSPKEKYLNRETIKPKDAIILTKQAGLEGTGIIANDFSQQLTDYLTTEEIDNAKKMLDQLSVIPEGVIAGAIGVSSMHDVTEGGVLGAVWEICECSNTGAEIYYDKIPVANETLKICEVFQLDFLKLISSGCMLITVSENKKDTLLDAFKKQNIHAAEIGIITDNERYLIKDGIKTSINPPESDELYKVTEG